MVRFFLLLSLFSCIGGGNQFSGLEPAAIQQSAGTDQNETKRIVIDKVIPDSTSLTVNLTDISFAVFLKSGAPLGVVYTYYLDNVAVQSTTEPTFELVATSLTTGSHSLKVTAAKDGLSDSRSWAIYKNGAPTLTLNSLTPSTPTIYCDSDTITLSVVGIDPEAATVTFSYYLDDVRNDPTIAGSSTFFVANVTFTPTCTQTGSRTLTIRGTDPLGAYSEYDVSVTVLSPYDATISGYYPTANPVILRSTDSVDFSITASGSPPLTYRWTLNPGSIALTSCNDRAFCTITASNYSAGSYTLGVVVTDARSTTDSHTFNLFINAAPQITAYSPVISSTLKFYCALTKNFQVSFTDGNYPSQTYSVTWKIDDLTYSEVTSTLNTSAATMVSSATFSPDCSDDLLGAHVLKATVSDGLEETTYEWDFATNFFSDACNNLTSQQICTFAGFPGMNNGATIATADIESLRTSPVQIISHTSGYFMSDQGWNVVWFYNTSASSVTVLGVTVAAGTWKIVAGNGTFGPPTTNTLTATSFALRTPAGIAWESSSSSLYIAENGGNRILKILSDGSVVIFAGGGAGNVDGTSRTTHSCVNPSQIYLDETGSRLFTTCNANVTTGGTLKYFKTNLDQGYSVTIWQTGVEYVNGTTGTAGTGRTVQRLFGLAKQPGKDILYISDLTRCNIVAVSYGADTQTYYGGALTLAAGQILKLTNTTNPGTGACGNTNATVNYTNTLFTIYSNSLEVHVDGSNNLLGIFYAATNFNHVGFLNTSSASITLGGVAIASGFVARVAGTTVASYNRGIPASSATAFSGIGILTKLSNTALAIPDVNNSAYASFNIGTTNGTVVDIFTGNGIAGFDGDTNRLASRRLFSSPFRLKYHEDTNSLLIADQGNGRIRQLSLDTGELVTKVGRGTSVTYNDPELPALVYMPNLTDLEVVPNYDAIFYLNGFTAVAINQFCLVRAFNMSSNQDLSIFNQTVASSYVKTISGSFTQGCQSWVVGNIGAASNTVGLRYPIGLAIRSDGAEMYIASNADHCISRVDSSGNFMTPIGGCGTANDVNSSLTASRFNSPADLEIDSDTTNATYGNFFVVDRYASNPSYLKYVNLSSSSVSVMGVTIGANSVGKLLSTTDLMVATANFDTQVCVSLGGNNTSASVTHNVRCYDRSTGALSLQIGKSSTATVRAGVQLAQENEGVDASTVSLYRPFGLAFDSEGNLYISEVGAHIIRKIKRWY